MPQEISVMPRMFAALSILVVAFAATGCGAFSTQEAMARCDQERDTRNQGGSTSCLDDDAYQACVAAYEDCGEDVYVDGSSCPIEFTCVDD